MVKNELENKLRFFDIEAKNNIHNTDNQVGHLCRVYNISEPRAVVHCCEEISEIYTQGGLT